MGKKILVALLIVMTTIIIVLAVLIATFDLNKYKPQIEKKVYEATGKVLKINGDIGLSLSPFGVSIKDIIIKNPRGFSSEDMLKLKKVAISLKLMPLLSKHVKVNYIELKDMDLLVEKSRKGVLNLSVKKSKDSSKKEIKNKSKDEQSKSESKQLPIVNVNKIIFSNFNIVYNDLQNKTKAKINSLNLTVNDIVINGDKDILKALSLKGLLRIASIKYDKYVLKDMIADFSFKDKVAVISPLKFTTFNSLVDGKIVYNMNGKKPKILLEDHIAKLDLKNVSKVFIKTKKISLDGYVKADIKLSMLGQTPRDIKRSLSGTVYVKGDNFGIKGIDLNKVFKSLDDAKSINKKDIAGFLIAGPLGVALSKGLSGGNLMAGFSGGTTAVKKMIIDAKIKKGIVYLKDVAMKVGQTRVALKGKVDLKRERLYVSAGVVGGDGCPKIVEDIKGTFSKPSYDTKALTSGMVTNTVNSLLSGLGGFVPKKTTKKSKCKVFYNGVVK